MRCKYCNEFMFKEGHKEEDCAQKPEPLIYTWENFDYDCIEIINVIKRKKWCIQGIYGIPKGGLPLAVKLANHLDVPLYTRLTNLSNDNVLVVDDISDSGQTLFSLPFRGNYKTITLFTRKTSKFIPTYYCQYCHDEWIVFPWEPKDKKFERDGTKI